MAPKEHRDGTNRKVHVRRRELHSEGRRQRDRRLPLQHVPPLGQRPLLGDQRQERRVARRSQHPHDPILEVGRARLLHPMRHRPLLPHHRPRKIQRRHLPRLRHPRRPNRRDPHEGMVHRQQTRSLRPSRRPPPSHRSRSLRDVLHPRRKLKASGPRSGAAHLPERRIMSTTPPSPRSSGDRAAVS